MTVPVDALLAPDGRDVLAALTNDGTGLATLTRLRASYDADLVAAAATQVELRHRARERFTRADLMFFTRDGLEQSSTERAAVRRAARLEHDGGEVVDLCCGIGGDTLALAACADVLAVDRDATHAALARHNAHVYGYDVRTEVADVRDVDLAGVAAVHVDPARRSGGRRLPAGASEPPLDWCVALTGSVAAVAVKVAPGLGHELIPDGWEFELVADGRDLLEAVLWSPARAETRTRAVVLPSGDELLPDPGDPPDVREPGRYLLDPSPAVTRAGLVAELARSLGAWQLDRRIAFLSSDVQMTTPFGRCLEILDSLPFDLRALRRIVAAREIGALDVRRRGLAGDVDDIRRRLRPRGPNRAVLVMTRVNDRPWALVCNPVDS